MKTRRTSVGLAVHARPIVACELDADSPEVFEWRLCPNNRDVLHWIMGYLRRYRCCALRLHRAAAPPCLTQTRGPFAARARQGWPSCCRCAWQRRG